jgi:hypothetical protein
MFHDIVAAHGQLDTWGIDFASKLLAHHSSPWVYIPYAILVIGAVGLQYLQMARLNARNPQANQANPQAAMLQKYMPLIFGFIYLNVAAILNVYFIVSSAIRIGTQEVLFRKGIVPGPGGPSASAGAKPRSVSSGKEVGIDSSERALPKPKGPSKGANGKATSTSGAKSASSDAGGGSTSPNEGPESGDAAKKHPRSKAKKERKAR